MGAQGTPEPRFGRPSLRIDVSCPHGAELWCLALRDHLSVWGLRSLQQLRVWIAGVPHLCVRLYCHFLVCVGGGWEEGASACPLWGHLVCRLEPPYSHMYPNTALAWGWPAEASRPGINILRLSWPQGLLPRHPLNAPHPHPHSGPIPPRSRWRLQARALMTIVCLTFPAGDEHSEVPHRGSGHPMPLFPKPGVLCGL